MESNQNNLVDVVKMLRDQGYTEELRLYKTHLRAIAKGITLEAKDFEVDTAYRFEGSGSEEDASEIFAVTASAAGIKGLLIDELAQFRKLPDHPIIEKLFVEYKIATYDDSQDEAKYGVPKVRKSKFNEDPDRYELRRGFPDFPPCPYGNTFSMLGYDKVAEQYVWLVSSIMQDDRLQVVDYAA
ncbi:MAG: hypothetical protein AAGA85_21655 [Bacteroidota bacterium]